MTATDITELTDIEPAGTAQTETTPRHLTPRVRAQLVTGTQVHVTAGSHEFTIDEPAGLGGTDLGANPVEHLLAALGACQVITFQVWAGTLGLRLDSVDVQLSGHLDLRGFFGTAASAATIAWVLRSASSIKGLISAASGRLRQYFFGISACIALVFSRAGLKMLA